MHTRGTEHQIGLQIVEIRISKTQLTACLLQFQHFGIDLLPGGAVTAYHITAKLQQQPHQRPVADTQTKNSDLLPIQGGKIFLKCRIHVVFPISIFFHKCIIPCPKRFCKTFDNRL